MQQVIGKWQFLETLRHFELAGARFLTEAVLNEIAKNLAQAKQLKVLKFLSLNDTQS
jgi:hypothetical protein